MGYFLAVTRTRLDVWEVQAVLDMDARWLSVHSQKAKEPEQPAMTPGMFKAMFGKD